MEDPPLKILICISGLMKFSTVYSFAKEPGDEDDETNQNCQGLSVM